LFAWPLAKIAAVVPITQGGIGVREAALVVLLAPFGAPLRRSLPRGSSGKASSSPLGFSRD
jgi:glycosyltransferase 2 family protein